MTPRTLPLLPRDDGRVRWFGESWGAPINETTEQVETPVGAICPRCDKPIVDGQRGVTMTFVPAPGERQGRVAYHMRCQLIEILGPNYLDLNYPVIE